ncbi:MAG: pilus assembly protein PilP [Gammaproteobacteria bacterium]|nr:MAG: pilus assembly protein PilP [Gammaproteobacteria bacterium]
MSLSRRNPQVGLLALAATTLLLGSGCSNRMDDLEAYIDQVKARPGGRIEPLPEVRPAPSHVYTAGRDGLRSPFIPDTRVAARPGGVDAPDRDRPRQYLEQFPLDTMRMVGTLDLQNQMFALVQTSDGLVHRVAPGNYLGQSDGRITSISESEIRLTEIVADGLGGYMERPAALALSEN